MAELVARAVREAGIGRQTPVDRVRQVWAEAVGRETANQTHVASLQGGVLVVEVASAALAQELAVYHKQALLKRLSERSGVRLGELRCRVTGVSGGRRT